MQVAELLLAMCGHRQTGKSIFFGRPTGQHHDPRDVERTAAQLWFLRAPCPGTHQYRNCIPRRVSIGTKFSTPTCSRKRKRDRRISCQGAPRSSRRRFLLPLHYELAGSVPRRVSTGRLDRGRDGSNLPDFASRLAPMWRSRICSECSGTMEAPMLCRRHLLAAAKAHAPTDLRAQRSVLRDLSERVTRYQKSFVVGGPKANERGRAALIAAIGWCSGWRPLLALLFS
jgi:hypothetical protein